MEKEQINKQKMIMDKLPVKELFQIITSYLNHILRLWMFCDSSRINIYDKNYSIRVEIQAENYHRRNTVVKISLLT